MMHPRTRARASTRRNAPRHVLDAGVFSRVGTLLSTSFAAGTDLKVVQETLGHSSIVLTCDTYTSVLPEIAHRSAEATAKLVLAAARKLPDDLTGRTRSSRQLTERKRNA
jgi:hypothetical protein